MKINLLLQANTICPYPDVAKVEDATDMDYKISGEATWLAYCSHKRVETPSSP